MNEPEIIKLRKQIILLNNYNVELKTQLEEQSIKLGEFEKKYNQLSFDYKNQTNQNNIINNKNKENLKQLFENSLLEEKQQINKYKDSNIQLSQKIELYEKLIKEKDLYIDKLVKENNNLKKDLINSSNNKNNAIDYFEKKKKEEELEKINNLNDKKKIITDFNKLCDDMEDIIRENRILRQMADVPENFGIDISKIKFGEKVKIEDYKTKIRLLIHEVDELETERAKLKHNIYFLASSLQLNEPPFHLLSKEQKVDVAVYAQKLYEGKINNEENDKKYNELKLLLEQKNIYIKKLENELQTKNLNERHRNQSTDMIRSSNFSMRNNNRYGEINNSINNNGYGEINNSINNNRYGEINNNINSNENNNDNDNQMNEIINILKQQKEEFKKIMINKRSMNSGNIYNIFHYNNNIILNPNNDGRFKNYLDNGHRIIRRSAGKDNKK